MGSAAACQIARLPEEVLWEAISRTSPRDACRAAAVSPAFRAAADSDAVWSTFLPRDPPPLADGELSPAPTSKKGLYLRLSDRRRPFLLQDRPWSYWLDRETGAKCYMLLASALRCSWSEEHLEYWDCWSLDEFRSSEGHEVSGICVADICGVIHSKMLSQNSTYAAYMVSRIPDIFCDVTFTYMDAHVIVGGSKSTRRVILAHESTLPVTPGFSSDYRYEDTLLPEERSDGWVEVAQPQERSDGWMEVEMGELYNEEGVDDEVHIRLNGDEHGATKSGLIVQGIEIRPKKSGQEASSGSDGERKSTRRVVTRDEGRVLQPSYYDE